jgi:geranylgeranyl pyrophosphate synthase
MHAHDLNPVLDRYKAIIEKGLSETYRKDSWLSKAAREALQAGGKRLRPLITLLVCEAISKSYEEALPVALCYELAHSASLIQDDIIDESTLRHSTPTAQKKYGLSRAILLSDSLIFEIFAQLARYRDSKITRERFAQLVGYVAQAAKLAADGEFMELALLSSEKNMSEADYLRTVALKTGALFAAAAASGAVVAGAGEEITKCMYEFGETFGIAFQIGDDILDILGDTRTTGKPALKDVQNNSSNIVLTHALSKADTMQRNVISSLLFKKWFSAPEAERLRLTLRELGSFEYAGTLLSRQAAASRDLLQKLPESEARETLLELTHTLEIRME